jgi:hypothetical protein
MINDEIRFLRDAAEELRQLATLSPEIAGELRRLATELDVQARRLEDQGQAGDC